jgi:hypothetical protein
LAYFPRLRFKYLGGSYASEIYDLNISSTLSFVYYMLSVSTDSCSVTANVTLLLVWSHVTLISVFLEYLQIIEREVPEYTDKEESPIYTGEWIS